MCGNSQPAMIAPAMPTAMLPMSPNPYPLKRRPVSEPATATSPGSIDIFNPVTVRLEQSISTPACSPAGLALTSNQYSIRRLGGKRWQALHRLIYVCAMLGVIHYYWLVKSDVRKPLIYAFFVGILLLWRVWDAYFRGKGNAPAPVRSGVSAAG